MYPRVMQGECGLWTYPDYGNVKYPVLDANIPPSPIPNQWTRGNFFLGKSGVVEIDDELPVRLKVSFGMKIDVTIGDWQPGNYAPSI